MSTLHVIAGIVVPGAPCLPLRGAAETRDVRMSPFGWIEIPHLSGALLALVKPLASIWQGSTPAFPWESTESSPVERLIYRLCRVTRRGR